MVELDSYMEKIVTTTVGSVIPKVQLKISKKKKSIHKIKEEVYDIVDVEDLVLSFRQSYTAKLKDHMDMFKALENFELKRVNKLVADLKFLTKEISMKQLINSNLEGLAAYLARLKVTILTKDLKVIKRILNKFVKQKDLNLEYVSEEIRDFSVKLDNLENTYMKFIDMVNLISVGLENKVLLSHEGVHKIEDLRNVVVKQTELLYHISERFKDVCLELRKLRGCKKLMSEVGL